MPDASPLRDRMVFLVGAQRSGTNWLQRMLATHPDIVSLPGETQLFTVGVEALARNVQHGTVSSPSTATVYMDRAEFIGAVRAFCDAAFGGVADRLRPGAARVLERSPNHVEHLDLIGDVYPDAWVVHIVRDGRDVARSLVSMPWGPTTVADAADLWQRSVRGARVAAKRLARYREVRYEDLLADPAARLAELLDFLGVDSSDATVRAALHEAGIAFNTDMRRPDIGDGKWRQDWGGRELRAFNDVAGELLVELGYRRVDRVPPRPRPPLALPRPPRPRRRAATPSQRPYLPLEVRQRKVDALVAALAAGDVAAVVVLLAPAARVRVVGSAIDRQARAEAGHELLASWVAADPPPWGSQRRGDVHIAGTMFTVVLSHEAEDGSVQRVIVAAFDGDDRINGLTLYRFPL